MSSAPFDFGLDEAQEACAASLHRDSILIDLLYQGPIGPCNFSSQLEKKVIDRLARVGRDVAGLFDLVSVPIRMAVSGELNQFHDLWLASGLTGGNREIELASYDLYADLTGLAQLQFDHLPWMAKALRAHDFRVAKDEGKFAGFVSTQLVSGPFPSLGILEHAWAAGLRMVQLTYNSRSTVGCGCTDPDNSGVTGFGRQAIALMNRLGIIVDTAHCGERTTLDACDLSTQPIVASHTAAAALLNHNRCKSDEELRAIAETGGVIGIFAVPFFLSASTNADINVMLEHIDHVANLVGPEHVAIGTDWPNQLPNDVLQTLFQDILPSIGFRPEHNIDPTSTLDGFRDYLDFPNITRGLVARGYSDDEIQGILGENFLRVFERVCG